MAQKTLRGRFGGGAFLLGMALAGGFFGLLSLPAFEGSSIRRYCLSHDVEKIAIVMFCWGLGDLLVKAIQFAKQRRALSRKWFKDKPLQLKASEVDQLVTELDVQPASVRESWMGERLLAGLDFVQKKGSASGLDEHLRYLGDVAADRSHASFALVRVIAWMIPILGFLGTVVGITIAVANVSPNQLDSSLTEVTGGLAMAFDATAVALALAMMLMFAYFLVERAEGKILNTVEDLSGNLLRHRFVEENHGEHPAIAPIRLLGETIVKHTQALVESQAGLWQEALLNTSKQTDELLARQQALLAEWLDRTKTQSEIQHKASAALAEQIAGLEGKFNENAVLLKRIIDDGTALVPLQTNLAENLHALRQSQGLDDAMHSLTAAIHLLTARARPAMQDRAA